jgi:hypothetical protein
LLGLLGGDDLILCVTLGDEPLGFRERFGP